MDINGLKKFIDQHSRFTDSVIEGFEVKKLNTVEFIITSRFEGYKVRVILSDVTEMRVTDYIKFSIWELELKYENSFFIFDPIPIYRF